MLHESFRPYYGAKRILIAHIVLKMEGNEVASVGKIRRGLGIEDLAVLRVSLPRHESGFMAAPISKYLL